VPEDEFDLATGSGGSRSRIQLPAHAGCFHEWLANVDQIMYSKKVPIRQLSAIVSDGFVFGIVFRGKTFDAQKRE